MKDLPRRSPLGIENRITLQQVRVFRAVADRLSFSEAARQLRLSQPSVSYQIKELERAIGLELLDRQGRRVELTQSGRTLYEHARRILNAVDETGLALEAMLGLERGTLRVGASTTVGIYLIPAALGAFKKLHPGLVIALEIGSRGAVQQAVLRNDLDLAIVGPVIRDPDLVSIPFMDDELVLVAPSGHRLAGVPGLQLTDLAGEPFILREDGSGTRWEMEKAADKAGVKLEVAMELGSNGAIKHAVESGLGVAAISRYAIGLEQTSGRLEVLDVAGFPIVRSWNIVHLRREQLSPPLSRFIEFLRSVDWRSGRTSGD